MGTPTKRIQLSRNGALVLAAVWLVATYAAGSFALSTGSWLWYGLTALSIWQTVKMTSFYIKHNGKH